MTADIVEGVELYNVVFALSTQNMCVTFIDSDCAQSVCEKAVLRL